MQQHVGKPIVRHDEPIPLRDVEPFDRSGDLEDLHTGVTARLCFVLLSLNIRIVWRKLVFLLHHTGTPRSTFEPLLLPVTLGPRFLPSRGPCRLRQHTFAIPKRLSVALVNFAAAVEKNLPMFHVSVDNTGASRLNALPVLDLKDRIDDDTKLWTILTCAFHVDKLARQTIRACKSCPKWSPPILIRDGARGPAERVPAADGETATVSWRFEGGREIGSARCRCASARQVARLRRARRGGNVATGSVPSQARAISRRCRSVSPISAHNGARYQHRAEPGLLLQEARHGGGSSHRERGGPVHATFSWLLPATRRAPPPSVRPCWSSPSIGTRRSTAKAAISAIWPSRSMTSTRRARS